MKINNKNTSNRSLITIVVLVVATLVIGGSLWLYGQRQKSTDNHLTATPQQVDDEKKTDAAKKQDFIEDSGKGAVRSVTVTPSSDPSSVTLSPTQKEGAVIVSTQIKDFPDGTCTLDVLNGTKKMTYTADILYQPEYSICTGFSVPISDLGTGKWSLTLTAKSSSGVAATNTSYVEVR